MRIFYHNKNLYLNNSFLFKRLAVPSSPGLGSALLHTLTECYSSPGVTARWPLCLECAVMGVKAMKLQFHVGGPLIDSYSCSENKCFQHTALLTAAMLIPDELLQLSQPYLTAYAREQG